MTVFRIVVVGLLCALPARAQRAVAPAELGRAAAPVPTLSLPAVVAPSALAPGLSAPVLPASPVLQAPVPLKLEAANAAVAEFSALDLKAAPAAAVRGGAEVLMARVLGADAPEAPALAAGAFSAAAAPLPPPGAARERAAEPRVHLLSKPLHSTVELGMTARVLHYAIEIGLLLVKAALAWRATGSPAAAAGFMLLETIKVPPMITAQSLADLGLRYWWRKLGMLRRIADTPGVTRIRVLTTGEAEFAGILARRKENTGLVFVDAEGALPAEIPGFGAPLGVAGLDAKRARLTLIHEGAADPLEWTPTLLDLLSGAPVPPDVAEAWRARLDADKKDKTPLRRLLDFTKEKELRIEARLGAEPPRTIVFGRSVKRLIGLGRWDRLKALFGVEPVARGIPISDTAVERGGRRAASGVLKRAWLRATGGLLVRP